jgi:phosphoribosylamine-glycine ligase
VPKKGVPIEVKDPACTLIHAGTKKQDGRWVTNGGRVLNLATVAPDLATARERVNADLERVTWPKREVRRDIGLRALEHAKAGKTVQDAW